jgi:hypothetical protein
MLGSEASEASEGSILLFTFASLVFRFTRFTGFARFFSGLRTTPPFLLKIKTLRAKKIAQT